MFEKTEKRNRIPMVAGFREAAHSGHSCHPVIVVDVDISSAWNIFNWASGRQFHSMCSIEHSDVGNSSGFRG